MSIKKIIKYTFLSSIILSTSCSTMIKMKYLKPASVNLGTKRRIAVLNFDISGTINDFYRRTNSLPKLNSNYFSEQVLQDLINSQYFTVIERQEISKVISEQGLNSSGFVNSENAIKLGKLSGAEVIMMGSGNYSVDETISKSSDNKEYTNRTVNYQTASLKRSLTLNINYRIIDTLTGEIITSRNLDEESYDSVSSFPLAGTESVTYKSVSSDPFVQTNTTQTQEEPIKYFSLYDKIGELDTWQTLLSRSKNKISSYIVYHLTPHYVEEDREIKDGESSNMKQAVELAKKGDWENAKYLWESTIKDPTASKDYVNAMSNLGTYYEVNSDYQNALFYFDQAYKYSNNNEVYQLKKEKIQKRLNELDILKEQGLTDTKVKTKRITPEEQVDKIDHVQLATKFQSLGNFNEAINEYKKALEQKPDDILINANLANLYYSLAKYDDAINFYTKVVNINPNEATSYFNLALAYQAAGKINQSKDIYLKSCQLGFKGACDTLLNMK
ncbi:MAG: DUF6340 family protein [Candidatus Sericytochromatia bacterium]